ncbi:MAG: hypothetical protein ACI8W7_002907, partial [Gammaproteobacteria bacterium]
LSNSAAGALCASHFAAGAILTRAAHEKAEIRFAVAGQS